MDINEYFERELSYDISPGLSIMNVIDTKYNKRGIFYFEIRKSDPGLYDTYKSNQFSDNDEIIKISFLDAEYIGQNILTKQDKINMINFIHSEWIDIIFEESKKYNTFWDFMIDRMNQDSSYFKFGQIPIPDYNKLEAK